MLLAPYPHHTAGQPSRIELQAVSEHHGELVPVQHEMMLQAKTEVVGCCGMPVIVVGRCWMAVDIVGRWWMPVDVVGCCWVTVEVVECQWVLLGASGLLNGCQCMLLCASG